MPELLQLATTTIDLNQVSELYDYDDYVLVMFSADHNPPETIFTGEDAALLLQWLDDEWQRERAESLKEGVQLPEKRPRYHLEPEPPDINEPPPF